MGSDVEGWWCDRWESSVAGAWSAVGVEVRRRHEPGESVLDEDDPAVVVDAVMVMCAEHDAVARQSLM
ncbi:hypothetical protein [Agromyces sp. NPDC055658]